MRRLIAFVARLYPRSWREEYDREFHALLDDLRPNWRVFGNVLGGAVRMQISEGKSWIRLAVSMSVLGAIVGGTASFMAAPHYVASASIGLTPQPDPLRPLSEEALRNRAMQRFALNETNVLSRQSLAAIIQDPALGLYEAERRRMPLEDIEDRMRRDIRIRPQPLSGDPEAAVVYDIAFSYPDPAKAQATVRTLANKLVGENDNASRERMAAYREFRGFLTWANRAGSAPPPPVGDAVTILSPPTVPKEPRSQSRVMYLAAGSAVGLLLVSAAAAAWQWKRRFWRLVGFGAAGWVLAVAASFLVPNRYTASAVMTISPATLTRDPLQPTPSATSAEEFLRRMEPIVLSTERLSLMIQDPHLKLYTEDLRSKPTEDVVRSMRTHDIRIAPLESGSSAFRISFSYPDRKKAQDGVNALITRFIDESWQVARAHAEESDVVVQEIIQRRGGEYLSLVDAPTLPQAPVGPPRLAISLAGLLMGLLVGVVARNTPVRFLSIAAF